MLTTTYYYYIFDNIYLVATKLTMQDPDPARSAINLPPGSEPAILDYGSPGSGGSADPNPYPVIQITDPQIRTRTQDYGSGDPDSEKKR
jgi:hypothetical protein